MIEEWGGFPIDDVSDEWRFEVIHDMPQNKKNGSFKGKQFKFEDSWVIGMYKKGSEFDNAIFEVLICYNRDGDEKYYAKIKVEMNECADKRKKNKSHSLIYLRNSFLEKWKGEFEDDKWKTTRKTSKPPPHNSISVMKKDASFEQLRYDMITIAQNIDEQGWI